MVVPQIISQLPGKSLVSRHVTRRAVNASVEDIKIGHTYLGCSKSSTEVQVISTIGQQLNDEDIYYEDEHIVKMPGATERQVL
jgi:Cdc6-like AAA superfamily ATPase